MRKLSLAYACLIPAVQEGMLITPTRHFWFYTVFNALAGVSSSVIQTPDNILKYQRIQVFFWSGVPCVFSSEDWAAAGRKVSCSKGKACGDFPAVLQQGSAPPRCLLLCSCPLWGQSSLLLVGLDLRRHFSEKPLKWFLQWCLYSFTSKIPCSQGLMLTVFFRCFIPCNLCCVCLYAREGLSETVLSLLRTIQRGKNNPNCSVKIGRGRV